MAIMAESASTLVVSDDEYAGYCSWLQKFYESLRAQIAEFETLLEQTTEHGVIQGNTARNLRLIFNQAGIVGMRTDAYISDILTEANSFIPDIDAADKYLY